MIVIWNKIILFIIDVLESVFNQIYCICLISQQQGRPYNIMKEALLNNPYFHYLVSNGFEEKYMKYFSSQRRRGVNPNETNNQNNYLIHDPPPQTHDERQRQVPYPKSAFGIVQSLFQGQTKMGMGAIIHKNLIVTLSSISQHTNQSPNKIWFIPFCNKQQRLIVKKIHPSNERRLNEGVISEGRVVILQLDQKINLQEKYGSFSINFSPQPSQLFSFIGITHSQDQYQVFEDQIHATVQKDAQRNIANYILQRTNYLPLSLITKFHSGQYQIVGIHVQYKRQKGEGILLSKNIWDQFAKLTFKGQQLSLCHENVNMKAIKMFKQANMRKLKNLQLMKYSLGNQELLIISTYKQCELTRLYLGHNKIRDDYLENLRNTHWNIQYLSLTNNLITFESMKTLSMMGWKNMRIVDLSQNKIGAKGSSFLSKCDWRNLQQLNLSKAQIDDAACNKLRKSKWPHLKTLQLDHNHITRQGICLLTNADWKMLKYCALSSNFLRYEGVKQLIRAHWPKIKTIIAQKNTVGRKFSELRNRIGDKFKSSFVSI